MIRKRTEGDERKMDQGKKTILTNPIMIALTAMLCCALWGSATPFIKIGYELILPERNIPSTILFAGARFFVAGIVTVISYSIARRKWLFPKKGNWDAVVKVSCFQTMIQYFLFYIGVANTVGVKATVISGSNTFFSILCATLIFRQEKLTAKKIFACLVGFAGIVLINLNGLSLNLNLLGDGFVLLSNFAYGISGVLMKRYSNREDPVIISGYQFVLGGFVMMVIGLLFGGVITITSVAAAGVLLYLALLSSIAYSLWGVLLKYNPVSKVSIYSFMTPVFGAFLSNLMLDEKNAVSPVNVVIALILICTGITVLNYKKEVH